MTENSLTLVKDTTNIHIPEVDHYNTQKTHLEKLMTEYRKIKFGEKKTLLKPWKLPERKDIICRDEGLDSQQVCPLKPWDNRENGKMFSRDKRKALSMETSLS